MQHLFFIIITLVSINSVGRENPFNKDEWWQRLVYEESLAIENLSQVDTSIVVVSNRAKKDDKLRFMDEYKADGELSYFFIYAYEGKWHVLEVNDLKTAIDYMPERNKDWVVYTEGMGKIFTSELDRGMMMASQYDVNVIMLDYPSITTTKGMLGNYFFAIKNARHAHEDHAKVLEQIKHYKLNGTLGSKSLNLFFHSMGNHLIRQTVKKAVKVQLYDTVWVNNLILNSACVPQRKHEEWIKKINFAEDIYVEYNPDDRVLKGAGLVSKKKQLGTKPRLSCKEVHYFNFSPLVNKRHSYFVNLAGRSPIPEKAYSYYNTILHGGDITPTDNDTYRQSTYNNIGYDIVP